MTKQQKETLVSVQEGLKNIGVDNYESIIINPDYSLIDMCEFAAAKVSVVARNVEGYVVYLTYPIGYVLDDAEYEIARMLFLSKQDAINCVISLAALLD